MSAHCCEHDTPAADTIVNLPRYKRVLVFALIVNAAMAGVEIYAGGRADSLALLADAVDFAADAFNYGVSLAVLTAALLWRSRAALFKAACMALFGVFILGKTLWNLWLGSMPDAPTMGLVGVLALAANLAVAALLYAFREGDANMRSVWLCTRNDAIGNVAVMVAAAGVFGTGSAWPDLAVASVMASLALRGAWQVAVQARAELQAERLIGGATTCEAEAGHAHHAHGSHHHH